MKKKRKSKRKQKTLKSIVVSMAIRLPLQQFKKYIEQYKEDVEPIQQFKNWFQKEKNIKSEEIEKMMTSLYQTVLYNLSRHCSPFSFEEQKTCVEHIVMEELYEDIFALDDEIKQDVLLINKIGMMQSIPIQKYHISSEVIKDQNWSKSKEMLVNINQYKSPTEKIFCINTCLRNIIYHNDITREMGCDEILEILTYLIVQSEPPLLYSNICFLRRCSFELSSENDYFLTQIEICIQIIQQFSLKESLKQYNGIDIENKIINSPPISSSQALF